MVRDLKIKVSRSRSISAKMNHLSNPSSPCLSAEEQCRAHRAPTHLGPTESGNDENDFLENGAFLYIRTPQVDLSSNGIPFPRSFFFSPTVWPSYVMAPSGATTMQQSSEGRGGVWDWCGWRQNKTVQRRQADGGSHTEPMTRACRSCLSLLCREGSDQRDLM